MLSNLGFKHLLKSKRILNNNSIRHFSAAPAKGPVDNGLEPRIDHQLHGDHHHAHVNTAKPDQTFIAEGINVNQIAFNGMKGKTNAVISVDN